MYFIKGCYLVKVFVNSIEFKNLSFLSIIVKRINNGVNISECSICGKNVPKLFKVEIEGTILEVCEGCLSYGERIVEKGIITKRRIKILHPIKEEEKVFVKDYGRLIIEARKKNNLTREEFAKKINEKESVIKRVEKEEMTPDDKLTEKIERFLDIKLKETYEEKSVKKRIKRGELTLGDVVEVE